MNKTPSLKLKLLPHYGDLPLPKYETEDAAGMDLCAAIDDDIILYPGDNIAIPSGLMMEIPKGYEGQIRPRSSLAKKYAITVTNTPGTIDADYRGEVMILLSHLGHIPLIIERGDRIAQLVIAPITQMQVEVADKLSETTRGEGGFGSTGRKIDKPTK